MIKKQIRKFYILMCIITMVIFNISGCVSYNNDQENPEESHRKIKIGVAVYDGEDKFIQSVYDMIGQYARQEEALGQVEIILEIADGQNNQEIQNGQIEAFINEGYDAIAVNIVDRAQAATIINKAQKADIPVVFFNREPVPQDMYICENIYYVGAEAEQSGKIQAEILIRAIKDGQKIDVNGDGIIQYVMLEGEPGHQDAILRTYYSVKALEEKGYKLENIATATGMWRKDIAKEKMLEWIEEFGGQIEVVMANNDEMALGAIEVLEEKGYLTEENKIHVVGVDGMECAKTAVKEGKMLGTAYNNAEEQGEAILSKIYMMVTGEESKTMKSDHGEKKYYYTNYEIIDQYTQNK